MKKLVYAFAAIALTFGTSANAQLAYAPAGGGVSAFADFGATTRSGHEINARNDRDRLSDQQWAGVFEQCRVVLRNWQQSAAGEVEYCRAVKDIELGLDEDRAH